VRSAGDGGAVSAAQHASEVTRRGRLVWLRRAGEVARIKAAIETWDASVAGADRRWLEPVADASRKGSSRRQRSNLPCGNPGQYRRGIPPAPYSGSTADPRTLPAVIEARGFELRYQLAFQVVGSTNLSGTSPAATL
jgi:hypothetical protein